MIQYSVNESESVLIYMFRPALAIFGYKIIQKRKGWYTLASEGLRS